MPGAPNTGDPCNARDLQNMINLKLLRNRWQPAAIRYAQIVIMAVPILLLLRLYEFIAAPPASSVSAGMMLAALGSDLAFAFGIAAIGFLFFLPLFLFSERAAGLAAIIAGWLTLLCYAGLIQYYVTASVPLGSDLFGYTWNDIRTTIASSGGISILPVFFGLLLSGAILAFFFFSKQIPFNIRTGILVLALCFISIPLFFITKAAPGNYSTEAEYQIACNKAVYFIEKSANYFASGTRTKKAWTGAEYPFYRDRTDPDVLGPYFSPGGKKPNLVFIIVEGLGRAFVGPNALHGGFTPFLDSLTAHSLFWENFLSTAGRTFSVLPSMFGSLPYGRAGFMELADSMPAHETLITLLRERGYKTNFFYGGSPHFDMQDVFLEREHIDFALDEFGFGPGYAKMDTTELGFTWGFSDGDLFKRSLELLGGNTGPRLDIYLTLSTHEPFLIPRRQYYEDLRSRLSHASGFPAARLEEAETYHAEFSGLAYFDDALRSFFATYQRRPDYQNTIFFITGDHRMNPIPHASAIDRFRVPMIVYSPMLISAASFASVSSHRDVTPSVIALLRQTYGMEFPSKAAWLGNGIDTCRSFRNLHTLPFMRTKNNLVDILDANFFLADGRLYVIGKDLNLEPSTDAAATERLQDKLESFKTVNDYVCMHNKLMPAIRQEPPVPSASLPPAVAALRLPTDQLFAYAQKKAFERNFNEARSVCRYLLYQNPNDHDVRALLGRTYAWEGDYDQARAVLKDVLRRAPFYRDAAIAMIDVETWSGHMDRAFMLADSLWKIDPKDKEVAGRRTSLLQRVGSR